MNAAEPSLSFAVRYEWTETSIPAPYAYEWIIEIENLRGRITFFHDYPHHNGSGWVRSFPISTGQINKLSEVCHTGRVFRTHWQMPAESSVSGPNESLTIWLDGQRYSVPSIRTAGANRALQPVWLAIRACVPQPVWDQLFALRDGVIRKYLSTST